MRLVILLALLAQALAIDYIVMLTSRASENVLHTIEQQINTAEVYRQGPYVMLKLYNSYTAATGELDAAGVTYVVEPECLYSLAESWGWDRVDQVQLPLDNAVYDPIGTGAGVYIYIVDSGVRTTHTEFSDPAQQLGQRASQVYEVSASEGPICGSHGTAVASHAAGRTVGVARRAWVRSVKVSTKSGNTESDCSILLSSLLEAMMWIIANAESPSIVNFSLAGAGSMCIDLLVKDMRDAGMVVVDAAGNSNSQNGACTISPARSVNSFTAAATTIVDSRWSSGPSSGSNYGNCIDIFAPGAALRAAQATSNSAYSNSVTGTSFASPHVAGAAAVLRQVLIDASESSTPAAVEQALRSNSILGVISDTRGTVNRLVHVGEGGQVGSGQAQLSAAILLLIFT